MDETNEGAAEQEVEAAESQVEALEEATDEEKDSTDWKAKFEEADGRRKRAEKQLEKSKIDKQVEKKLQEKTGELDETQLDYLDLKGVSESEDIKVIEDIVKKTGMTVRQALKDEYVQTKLTANKEKREVKAATPSSTKRTGSGSTTDLALALSRYEQTGHLPEDFTLRKAVVNAKMAKEERNKPSWQ